MNLLNLFNGQPKTLVSSVKYKKPADQQLVDKLTDFLKQSFKQFYKQGFRKLMLGMTGREFEFLAAYLLKQALKEFTVVIIFDFDDNALTNKLTEVCKQLSLETYILKRGKEYRNEAQSYQLHRKISIEHFYQRFLNYHLLTQADHMKAAVVDILDKSERLVTTRPEGFYGHLMPFYSLYKSELLDLAKFLGLPYQNHNSYWEKLDPVLYLLIEKQLSPEEISQQFNVDLPWLKKIKARVEKDLFQTPVSQFII